MTFQREFMSDELVDEIFPLLEQHWREIAHFQDIPLKPDWESYGKLESAGLLRVFTARDTEQKLIGYAAFFVRPAMHYMSSLQAMQDVIYVDPARRAGGLGARLIIWCDEQLKAEGVQAVYHHVKAAHNFGPLLENMGYQLVDLIYTRRLD